MVLIRAVVVAVAVLAGCSESLFGPHRADLTHDGSVEGEDSGSGDPQGLCTGSCISDAAAAFDGSDTGIGHYWRYLEDMRNRLWNPMTAGPMGLAGSNPRNHLSTCAAHPDAAACAKIAGALLVSAAGPSSDADPAIGFVAAIPQSIELRLRVAVPDDGSQTIRLYRNSREDVLFTATVAAGATVDQAILVDALAGDRFLVAIIPPTDDGATDVGLDLTVRASGVFPTSCQLAVEFELVTGNSITDVSCASAVLTQRDARGPSTPIQGAAPFVELHAALKIPEGSFLEMLPPTEVLDYAGDITLQLWVYQRAASASAVSVFSDRDAMAGGGVGISILPGLVPMLDVATGTSPAPHFVHATVLYPAPAFWHFLRIVRSRADLRVCIDGEHAMTIDAPAALAASHAIELGKDVQDPPDAALFDGSMDDLRVFTGALPCATAP